MCVGRGEGGIEFLFCEHLKDSGAVIILCGYSGIRTFEPQVGSLIGALFEFSAVMWYH